MVIMRKGREGGQQKRERGGGRGRGGTEVERERQMLQVFKPAAGSEVKGTVMKSKYVLTTENQVPSNYRHH